MIRLLLLTTAISTLRTRTSAAAMSSSIRDLDFEVYGRVQGVFFRKENVKEKYYTTLNLGTCNRENTTEIEWTDNVDIVGVKTLFNILNYFGLTLISTKTFFKSTKEEADKLGLRGWCKNTSDGTVLGHVQGPPDKIETMMHWLKTKGSPSSKIDKAEFRNQKEIADYTFSDFSIRKD